MYTYTWYHWITFFFIYSLFGWLFESTYVSVKDKQFVNRGFLRLPMLPLYGFGAILMLWISLPVQDNLLLVYFLGLIGATILEYFTGRMMELLFKVRYWDYSHKKFHFQGYICLGSSIAWGFLTILLTEVLHKPIERHVLSLSSAAEPGFMMIIGILFVLDTIRSAREAFDLAKALETMTKLKAEVESMQVQMTLLRNEISQRVGQFREDYPAFSLPDMIPATQARLSELKNETEAALTVRLEALADRLETVSKKRDNFSKQVTFYRKQLLRRHPTATSRKFAEALKELKESLTKKG